MTRGRRLAAAGAALALLIGGGAAYAATASPTATCTANPVITTGSTTQSVRVTCSWPIPKPVTSTVTSTVTVTAPPTSSSTTTTEPPVTTTTATPSPTTSTATPSPTTTAPTTEFPDATTGVPAGTSLKRIPEDVTSGAGWHYDTRGWVVIDGTGTTFTGYRVNTDVSVEASNVTVARNEIVTNGWPIALRHTTGVVIDQNTIRGVTICDNGIRGIYGDDDGVTITRNDIGHCYSGINHLNAGGLIRGNYIHDIGTPCDGSACEHYNGIQLGAGTGPLMTIDGNTILVGYSQTDAIMLANDDGDQRNRTITNNLLAGGGYTLYGSGGPSGVATGIVFRGNQFSTRYFPNGGYWGPVAYWKSGNVWESNTWADGARAGQPVNP